MPHIPLRPVLVRTSLAAFVLILCANGAWGQTGANVAVVINEASPASARIGEHYAAKRAVPASNIVRIKAPLTESVSRADYARTIEGPIGAALARHALQDQVLYIVLTKGVPLKIIGTAGVAGTMASVDSELTLLYRRLTGQVTAPGGPVPNPYHLGARPIAEAARFSHRAHDIYLVTRLDGFTVDDVIGLIDRGVSAGATGTIVLDARLEAASAVGDRWMSEAAATLRAQAPSRQVLLDETRQAAETREPVLGYFSWGSTDPSWRGRGPQLQFAPGAVAAMLTSTDARTFEEPPQDWQPSVTAVERRGLFAGSPQALLGDLVRAGVTGAAGNVAEPLLQSAVRPQILFPAYLAGFNLAESVYLALPHLSWQAVVVGDPLARPAAGAALGTDDAQPPVDPATGLPALFMERRLANLRSTVRDLSRGAAVLVLASEQRRALGDRAGAKEALARALEAAPDHVRLQMDLALLHEQDNEAQQAEQLYRAIIRQTPRNVIALNNLAFSLAVRGGDREEALALAGRAYALAPKDPTVMDTLGWIEHLSGNTKEGLKLLEAAARLAPEDPDIRLHAALALGSIGAHAEAAKHLQAAIALDGSLQAREDVAALKEKIGKK